MIGRSLAMAAVLCAGSVLAQGTPPPFGMWRGQSGDVIRVGQDGSCSVSGSVNLAGTCTWSATYEGGILTMWYQWTIDQGAIRWSVVWIDDNTLLVNGVERYFRTG